MRGILVLLLLFPLWSAAQGEAYAEKIAAHRATYAQNFLAAARSPLDSQGVQRMRYFPADSSYRLTARFERAEGAKPFEMATYSGKTKPYVAYGTLTFELQDTTLSLTVYQSLRELRMPGGRDQLFLPFKDATNGAETYGGGRYLDFSRKGIKDGQLVLDFNYAYNPYCAYSDGYNCPVPPLENHLPLPVRAGEQAYEKPTGDK